MAVSTEDKSELPDSRVSFDEANGRSEQMRDEIEAWAKELCEMTDEARASEEFQEWLDVQAKFHDYSHRNTVLIKQQMPEASKVAGYWTWQNEFDRHVKEGESAIWIWAPIIDQKCPKCGNSPSYHESGRVDCSYHEESDPDNWQEGAVGFKPTSVFDISQTEGEPVPELETEAYGDVDGVVDALLEVAKTFDIRVEIVDEKDWTRDSEGFCRRDPMTMDPIVKVRDRENSGTLARVLIHEIVHAELHGAGENTQKEREVEADAVAYIVSRYFGIDAENVANYLAAWDEDAPETLQDRLQRISSEAKRLISHTEQQMEVDR